MWQWNTKHMEDLAALIIHSKERSWCSWYSINWIYGNGIKGNMQSWAYTSDSIFYCTQTGGGSPVGTRHLSKQIYSRIKRYSLFVKYMLIWLIFNLISYKNFDLTIFNEGASIRGGIFSRGTFIQGLTVLICFVFLSSHQNLLPD